MLIEFIAVLIARATTGFSARRFPGQWKNGKKSQGIFIDCELCLCFSFELF
jgi:hypothetical protein